MRLLGFKTTFYLNFRHISSKIRLPVFCDQFGHYVTDIKKKLGLKSWHSLGLESQFALYQPQTNKQEGVVNKTINCIARHYSGYNKPAVLSDSLASLDRDDQLLDVIYSLALLNCSRFGLHHSHNPVNLWKDESNMYFLQPLYILTIW